MNKIHLMIIDPQNDFMDIPGAALPVPGANDDMNCVAHLIDKIGKKLEDIHVTLDSHRVVDVGHPIYWKGKDGNHPLPFTMITTADIENGTWIPTNPAWYDDQFQSAKKRETEGKKPNMVWPPHCLIGTWGHNVQRELMNALIHWETNNFANVNYKTKGSYPHREHYGGMEAEDPDPREPSTSLDMNFITMLSEADMILFTGEALSHCVMSTLNQVADNIGDDHLKKFYILTDCMSSVGAVPGADFPAMSKEWLKKMESRGINITNSKGILSNI